MLRDTTGPENSVAQTPRELELGKYDSHIVSFQSEKKRSARNNSMFKTAEPKSGRVYAKRNSMGAP